MATTLLLGCDTTTTGRPPPRAENDPRATPFGNYDAELIAAIKSRWYDLMDTEGGKNSRNGRVVVRFRLHVDGSVSDVTIVETSVSSALTYICQKAVYDPAPYEKWPADMQRLNNGDNRLLTISFYYNDGFYRGTITNSVYPHRTGH